MIPLYKGVDLVVSSKYKVSRPYGNLLILTDQRLLLYLSPSKHTTLFQRCNNVVDIQTTLNQRQNDVVRLLGLS